MGTQSSAANERLCSSACGAGGRLVVVSASELSLCPASNECVCAAAAPTPASTGTQVASSDELLCPPFTGAVPFLGPASASPCPSELSGSSGALPQMLGNSALPLGTGTGSGYVYSGLFFCRGRPPFAFGRGLGMLRLGAWKHAPGFGMLTEMLGAMPGQLKADMLEGWRLTWKLGVGSLLTGEHALYQHDMGCQHFG